MATSPERPERDVLHGGEEVVLSEFIANEAVVKMPVAGPIRLLFISDLHMFDPESSKDYIKQVFAELDKPHTYAILLGDIIQGFNPSRAGMAAGVPRLDEQMLSAETLLQRYADKGKLIAAVGGNHEGWGDREMTLDVNYFMLRNLRGTGGGKLPIMNNGGYITLEFPGGGEHRIRVYHDPGGGGSAQNMVGAQRARAMETPIDDPSCPDQVVGGHTHSRAMVTTELAINAITGEVSSQSFAAGGTAQGIDADKPNVYLAAKGVAPSLRGLPATILIPVDGDGVDKRDVWGLENSGELLKAIRLWDIIESRNMGAEIEGMIRQKMPAGETKFREDLSRAVVRAPDGTEIIKSHSYDVVRWNITTGVPIITYVVGGLRYGASTTDEAGAALVMAEAVRNPEAYVLNTRRMVDKGLSDRMDRETYLNRMVTLIEPAGKEGKILSLLMDSGLREPRWKHNLGKPTEDGDGGYSEAIMTGDYIQERVPGVPLIVNNSFVIAEVGGVEYRIWVRDKLGQNGSTMNPFGGLEAQKRKSRMRMDVAVGGHMPRVGVSQSESGVVVAPGGYAKWAEMGEANEELVPRGGQAVILYPGQRRVLACATFEQAKDTHRAVFYAEGIKHLPKDIQEKIMRTRRKTKRK